MSVKPTATGWAVVDGDRVLAEFPTHGAAWRWLDRQERRVLWCRRETADRCGGVYYEGERTKP
jgi:hypothetical protein